MLFVFLSLAASAQVKTGIEVLRERNFDILEGKRVGLVTNPTGVDRNLKSTIDILDEADNVNLVCLFGPEHGVRGDRHAGDKVESTVDPRTGLTVHSLYGPTRKPLPSMLKGLDVVVYDLQDIGCRSFTFISTMGLMMQACAENDIEFVVLDRPNPLGGLTVEGNIVDEGMITFVGQFRIPYLYGLTCGELAYFLNEEYMEASCRLKIVTMEGWKREMLFKDTGLPWVAPSPHIPTAETALYYPATGILGETGLLSIGIGYTLPFMLLGEQWIDAEKFAAEMNALELPGWEFRPIHYKPFYGRGKGKILHGVQLHVTDHLKAKLTEPQFRAIEVLYRMYPDHPIDVTADRYVMFDKVTGSKEVRRLLFKRFSYEDLKPLWERDAERFKAASKSYYLY